MKKEFIVLIAVYALFTSCNKDDIFDNNDNVVVINDNGKANGGHRFTKIDDTNFYVDDIKYTAKGGELIVTGYDPAFFKGEANIISTLRYEGRNMSVVSIANNAFENCHVITSVTIPNSITTIGYMAFSGCNNLKSVILNSDSIVSKSIDMWLYSYIRYNYDYNQDYFPNDRTNCYMNEIFGNQVQKYVIGNSVKSIGDYIFRSCTELTTVIIGDSVTTIGEDAFSECENLTSVSIGKSVSSIKGAVLRECKKLISIKVDSENKVYDSRNNCNAIIETKTNTLVTGCNTTIISEGVTCIGKSAFCGCANLTSIKIPESVSIIGESAFFSCEKLSSIIIPQNVSSIGCGAFEFCPSINSITVEEGNANYDSRNNCNAIIETKTNTLITGCKNTIIPKDIIIIGDLAFAGCENLASINIPNGVTNIEEGAFWWCTSLISITIPNSVTTIGDCAFMGCSGLTNISIPNSVTSIGDDAFYDCGGLTSVTIPNSVTRIGDGAFQSCTNLASITIPNSVTSIGDFAFSDCTSLSNIVCYAVSPPDCGYDVFGNVNMQYCKLYVPQSSISAYRNALTWGYFSNIIAIEVKFR